jgi:hypothetical protein
VKRQQAQAQVEAERTAANAQRGRAFTALAHVVAAAIGRTPTTGKATSHPHRPPSAGQIMGLHCEHCRNVFVTGQELRRHYVSGCPALEAG